MPAYSRESGSPQQKRVMVKQNGQPVDCEVWEMHNGQKRLLYRPLTVIEDWEDNDFSPYSNQGSGDYRIEGLSSWEGNYGLTLFGGLETVWSNQGDGLDEYPEPGHRIEVMWKTTAQTSPEFWFGTSAGMPAGHYQLEYFWDGNFQLRTYVSGNEAAKYQSGDNPVNLSVGTWYKFLIDWQVPWRTYSLVCELRNTNDNMLAGIYTNDTTHNNPAIGFEGDGVNNGKTFFDYVTKKTHQN